MEGVGKSTTVNHMIKKAMKTAEQLAAASTAPGPARSWDQTRAFADELTRRLEAKRTDLNKTAFADTPMSTIRHRHEEEIEQQMLREGWSRPAAAAPVSGGVSSSATAMD
eukprot:720288-Prymnesium_polylepis.1